MTRGTRLISGIVASVAAIATIAIVVANSPSRTAPAETPPIFSDLTLTEALEQNQSDGRILFVKGTAKWCPPCVQMDRTSLRDDSLAAWMKERGTAIALDVDRSPQDAQRLGITAMPTMIAFRDGVEVGRAVGFRSGADLLAWLEGLDRRSR
ncbi:MAG TPA: thioredoxin family protein [Phycisphaerales bacterium]|nr:thioredoxin family protein [Phycisphaerales bacterium]HMP38241.1 thioredoxin family protein [Phycisphaerales bacterium]